MKKLNILLALGAVLCFFQGYGAVSQQEMNKLKTKISAIITDDAVNANGKMIDNDVINKVIDYNIAVLAAISPANQDYVQNTLDTIRQQRLQEITAQKKKPEPKGKNIKKSARRTHSKGRRINLLAR